MGMRSQEFIRENIETNNNLISLSILIYSAKIIIFVNLKETTGSHYFLVSHHPYTNGKDLPEMRK
tara:strand:+ start:331 stop:525 length:195 start_codon:yes stop_codon:yes gene_type:complete